MPQLKTQKDNLTESEKERFQNAYISELKKLSAIPLPKDGVILNVHSIYRSPYQGDIESYIEVYGDNHEKLMRLTSKSCNGMYGTGTGAFKTGLSPGTPK